MSVCSKLVLGLLSLGLFATPANAQGFSIGIGGRGVRIGIDGGGFYGARYYGPYNSYGGGWGRGYGANWNAGGYPADYGPLPYGQQPTGAIPTGGPIEIASEADAVLKYSLNQYPFEIKAGQIQRLQEDRPWVIEFDRGGDHGFTTYALIAGRYKFVSTPDGWDLVRAKDQLGMDPPGPDPDRDGLDLDSRRNPPPLPLQDLQPSRITPRTTPTPPTPADALAPTELPELPPLPADKLQPTPVTPQPKPATPPLIKVKPRPAPTPPTPNPRWTCREGEAGVMNNRALGYAPDELEGIQICLPVRVRNPLQRVFREAVIGPPFRAGESGPLFTI